MALFTNGTTPATDVQLMQEYLLAGKSSAVKQSALVGVREMLNLPVAATAAECASALKVWLKRQIHSGYLATKERVEMSGAKDAAATTTDTDLWPAGEN